jgi:hypothetical protein
MVAKINLNFKEEYYRFFFAKTCFLSGADPKAFEFTATTPAL